MKGLQEKNDDGIFLQVKHGCICQESRTPREGFVPIEVTNVRTGDKVTKYIKRYKGVEALVRRIEWYDREHDGTRFMGWKLVLDANGTACTLDLPFESRVGSRFMKLAENIDFTQPIEFSAWKGPDDKTAFSVKQNNENVPQKYTRDEPGDCPAPVQGFNKKWNFDKQKEFLHARMVHVVIPRVQAINGASQSAATESSPAGNENNGHAKEIDISAILAQAQTNLKDYAKEKGMTLNDAIEEWFGTRVWAEVEKMEPAIIQQMADKLADEVIPF